VPDEVRRRAIASAVRKRFARGEVLFHEGDPGDSLHIIAKGRVGIRVTTALGDVAMLRVLGPGEVFGEQAVIVADPRRSATAIALEVVETHVLHRDRFDELRRNHPEIDRFLVEALVIQVRRLSDHLQEALFVASEKRVLRRLLELCDFYPEREGRVVIPLAQVDIASMAGASRSTANRIFKAAEADGLLCLGRGRVEVLDRAALVRQAR
jgi:CRP/FNR family cyclic AMP-dependent transcriptional regulator